MAAIADEALARAQTHYEAEARGLDSGASDLPASALSRPGVASHVSCLTVDLSLLWKKPK